ncbi:MAG: ABC transporter permease, partial [Thermodesulfobacteriota bacterium]|nr:ABC transporter permease [Thermodesulfobacteriota bacterium]
QGASFRVQEEIANLGTNMLIILSGSATRSGVRAGIGEVPTITVKDAKAIEKYCPSVSNVAYMSRKVMQVIFGNQNWSTLVYGVNSEYLIVRNIEVSSGRFITKLDEKKGAKVVLLGNTVLENLFGPGQDPIGQTIRIKNVPLKVIGVLSPKGQTPHGRDQDDVVLMPFSTAERRVIGSPILGTVGAIIASAESTDAISDAQEEIREVLRRNHHIPQGKNDDFSIRNLTEFVDTAKEATRVMTVLLASVASVSLIVGGIGIMNIMLVSVAERTREIGIRMAVGAKTKDILFQFMVESSVLSSVGGLIGIIFGIIGSKIISMLAKWPTVISLNILLLAFFFSLVVGVIFGLYPAHKASRLDPIESLRYE